MAITFNEVKAPDNTGAYMLRNEAAKQLQNAGQQIKATVDDYRNMVLERNHGLLQEYVNQAKSPEELQSEVFKQGYKNLLNSFKGEVNLGQANGYYDGRVDSLTKRAADQTALEANQFKLAQDKINAPIATDLAKAQLLGATQTNNHNAKLYPQIIAENEDKLAVLAATQNPRMKKPFIENQATLQGIEASKAGTRIAQQNADTNALEARARLEQTLLDKQKKQNEKNPALLLLSGVDKIDKDYAAAKLKPDNNPNAVNTLEDWYKKTNNILLSDTDLDNIKNIIETDPKLNKLSGKEKVFLAETSFQSIKNENTLGRNIFSTGGNRKQAEDAVKKVYSDISTRDNDYLYSQKIPLYRDAVRQYMLQTGSRDPVESARNVGMNEYEMYRTNIRTPLEVMAESLYKASESKLPKEQFIDKYIYGVVNKEPVDDLIKPTESKNTESEVKKYKQNTRSFSGNKGETSAFEIMQNALLEKGTPTSVNGSSQSPTALNSQEQQSQSQIKQKLLNVEVKEVKQSTFTDTPIKVLANAVKPVPSPLIPVESQNAYKTKENNLALDFRTNKSTITKDPVAMPKVEWKEPVQAIAINPIYAQLPQYRATVTYVPDGDTLRAKSKDYKTRGLYDINCRIDSIDAPETAKPQHSKKGQPYGEEAAKILQQMVLNKEVSIRVTKPTDGKSNYSRDVCQIEVAGKDVSVELLRAGAAWLYKEYNKYGEGGASLENTARKAGLGLWGLPNPVYPPDFRHNEN